MDLSNQIIEIFKKSKIVEGEINRLVGKGNPLSESNREQFRELLEEAEKFLYTSFVKISNADYIKGVKLKIGNESEVSLEIIVLTDTGIKVQPQNIFSEANYDLVILLLHLSLFRVCANNGQSKFLILDDVLQSVDSSIRTRFIEYLLSELREWQLIITCHDRLWLNQLKHLFNRNSHRFKEIHITGWTFLSGPTITSINHDSKDNIIQQAVQTSNPRLIAAACGVMLEKICHNLSFSLEVSLHRKYEDKYTIGDLWPSIKKTLKKSSIKTILDNIDSLLIIRNILGCHYNEWAESMSDTEVQSFAKNIQTLYDFTFCENCGSWISKNDNQDFVAKCKCGSLKI